MGLTKSDFKVEGKMVSEKVEKPKFEICTSWDDGGALDIKIASILKKYKLPAVFYIILDNVGKDGFLTWDQIKDLEKQGFEIGSHTMTHPSDLKVLYDEQLHYEIQNSKDMLEAVLGHPVSKFCYPRGRYDRRVQEFVIKAGYIEARGTGTPGGISIVDKYAVSGSIHIFQRPEYKGVPVLDFAKRTIDTLVAQGGYVNIWGHSQEIQDNNLWDILDDVLKYAQSKL